VRSRIRGCVPTSGSLTILPEPGASTSALRALRSHRRAAASRLASTCGFDPELARVESGHDTRINDVSEYRNTAGAQILERAIVERRLARGVRGIAIRDKNYHALPSSC
jgi:hypothetical protein